MFDYDYFQKFQKISNYIEFFRFIKTKMSENQPDSKKNTETGPKMTENSRGQFTKMSDKNSAFRKSEKLIEISVSISTS